MRTIVVGVDGSNQSVDALRFAQHIAVDDDLVRAVMVREKQGISGSDPRVPADTLQDAARQRLEAVLEAVPAGSTNRQAELIDANSPSLALIETSADADLLVLGTQSHSTMERLFIGSVAIQCAHHISGALIAVPEGAVTTSGAIAVAYDRSPSSRAALKEAADIAASLGERLRVISIIDLDSEREVTREHLEADAAAVAGDVERVDIAVVQGDDLLEGNTAVATALMESAIGARILMMGSRGRGGFAGLLLGSVSQRCLETATLPIGIIRIAD